MTTSRFLLTGISLLMGVAAQAESARSKPDIPPSITLYPFGKEEIAVSENKSEEGAFVLSNDNEGSELKLVYDLPENVSAEEENVVKSETSLSLTEEDKDLLELDLTDLILDQEASKATLVSDSAPAATAEELVQEAPVAAKSEPPVQESAADEQKPAEKTLALLDESTPTPVIEAKKIDKNTIQISLKQVFSGSPVIYTLLLLLSVGSIFIWLYNFLSLRTTGIMPETFTKNLRNKLNSNQFDEALSLCLENDTFFCKMLAAGIAMRRHGLPIMMETMKSEGRRATASYWQRIALINDIAIIAPMLGLLGTVLGMFYAFYDINRSVESVTTLFDGLGISVGTTVAGLIVAIVAMILNSLTKYRLVRVLTAVENEAQAFAGLLDDKTTVYPR